MIPGILSVWPPLPPAVYAHPRSRVNAFPLDRPDCRLYARARHALWHGVHGIGLAPGDELLVPAYHHGSEIEALVRAGLVCRFYDTTPRLEPDEAGLEAALSPRVRALYITHYLGFPQDAERWRTWCDGRGLLLLEDAAQAWLTSYEGRPVGSVGDLAIFCLYKTFGLPDGAALFTRGGASDDHGPRRLQPTRIGRRHAAWLLGRSGTLAGLATRLRHERGYSLLEDFRLGDPYTRPEALLGFLLSRVFDRGASAARRANYTLLLDDLRELVAFPFGDLPEGASPFAFPVDAEMAGGKDALLERLAASGIQGLDFWSEPHPTLPREGFPLARSLRSRVVGLPVHQELRPKDLERIASTAAPRAARRAELRLELVPDLEKLRDEWATLAESTGNVFATWEWNSIWWRHFGEGRESLTTACREADGRLVAILPLYVASERPLRVVRFIGHSGADHLAPIAQPSRRTAAGRALRRLLAQEHVDLFVGDRMPGTEGWAALLGGRVLRWNASPVLRIEGRTWDDFLAGRSANFRGQLRRRQRALERDHDIRFRLSDPGRLKEDMDTFFALHYARWDGGRASSLRGAMQGFQREFASAALDRGWLCLWFLEIDGRPVAAWYGFRFDGADSYYQAGRDPAWNAHSVGFVLLSQTIRQAFADGAREYRFLEGEEPFKYRFATEDGGLQTIAVARGPLATAALSAAVTLGRGAHVAALGRHLAGDSRATPRRRRTAGRQGRP